MYKWTLLFLTLVFLTDCSNPQGYNDQDVQDDNAPALSGVAGMDKSKSIISGETTADTVLLKGKFVLFFGDTTISSKDSSAIMKNYHSRCLYLLDSLEKVSGIKGTYTQLPYFRVYGRTGNPMTITQSALNTPAGVLVTDGSQPPSIRKGILDDSVYHKLFRDYFFLPAAPLK